MENICIKTLKKKKPSTVFLDGDGFREIINDNLGFDYQSRKKNSERLKKMCFFLDSQEINVICSVLSIFPEDREWCRKNLSNYYEIYVKVPIKILEKRDQKNIYSKALRGEIKNVVGVDLKFPEPKKSDLVIINSGNLEKFLKNVNKILSLVGLKE